MHLNEMYFQSLYKTEKKFIATMKEQYLHHNGACSPERAKVQTMIADFRGLEQCSSSLASP